MHKTVTLQTKGVSLLDKQQADAILREESGITLQEAVRQFIKKVAKREITIDFNIQAAIIRAEKDQGTLIQGDIEQGLRKLVK